MLIQNEETRYCKENNNTKHIFTLKSFPYLYCNLTCTNSLEIVRYMERIPESQRTQVSGCDWLTVEVK